MIALAILLGVSLVINGALVTLCVIFRRNMMFHMQVAAQAMKQAENQRGIVDHAVRKMGQ